MPNSGCRSIALAIVLSSADVSFAYRVHPERIVVGTDESAARAYGSLLEEEAKVEVSGDTAPHDLVLAFEVNKCTLMHMEAFQRGLSNCAAAVSPAEAVNIALETSAVRDLLEQVDGPLLITSEDEADIQSGLSFEGVTEDDVTVAMCVEGANFYECMKHLHPPMWLMHRWYITNLLGELMDDEEDPARAAFRAKLEMYKQATEAYGFAYAHTRSICTEKLGRPMEDQVRMCILDEALPDFLVNSETEFISMWPTIHTFQTRSLAQEQGHNMTNSTRRGEALRDWLLQYFRFVDEHYAYTNFATRSFQRQCDDAIDAANAQMRKYLHAIQGTLFAINGHATSHCEERVQSPMEAHHFLRRMATEVNEVCDPDGCTERPGAMVPEGFACDTRRAPRHGSNLAIGSTIGAITGLALVLSVPLLGVGVVGLVGGHGISGGALVAAGLAFPGKGPMMVTGAAVGSFELTPTCMAFPLICRYSPELDRCEIVPSKQQAAVGASNPFSMGADALPFTGFKCVPDGEERVGVSEGLSNWTVDGVHEALRMRTKCEQKACRPVDSVVEGPRDNVTGFQLFGRVGYDPLDKGVYNCLNAHASTHSSLPYLASLPDPRDRTTGTMENTAENRARLLREYLREGQ